MKIEQVVAWIVVSHIAFAPWARLASAGDLICGEGPHEIELHRAVKCEDRKDEPEPEPQKPTQMPDGTWVYPPAFVTDEVPMPACQWSRTETWTDWPTCPGAHRTGFSFSDGCNTTSCSENGSCTSTLVSCGAGW